MSSDLAKPQESACAPLIRVIDAEAVLEEHLFETNERAKKLIKRNLKDHKEKLLPIQSDLRALREIVGCHSHLEKVYLEIIELSSTSLYLVASGSLRAAFSTLRSVQELAMAYSWFFNQPFEFRRWARLGASIPTGVIKGHEDTDVAPQSGIFSTEFLKLSNWFNLQDGYEIPTKTETLIIKDFAKTVRASLIESYTELSNVLHLNIAGNRIVDSGLTDAGSLSPQAFETWERGWASIRSTLLYSMTIDLYWELPEDSKTKKALTGFGDRYLSHEQFWQKMKGTQFDEL